MAAFEVVDSQRTNNRPNNCVNLGNKGGWNVPEDTWAVQVVAERELMGSVPGTSARPRIAIPAHPRGEM